MVGLHVGLTDNPAALFHWMVSGPEIALAVGELEGSIEKKQNMDCCYDEQNNQA